MTDEQVQRYARHLALAEVGGLGQTALLVASARLVLREPEPDGELICGEYLAAGGVGTMVVVNASAAQRAALAAHGPDTQVVEADVVGARDVELAPKPPWWPSADGDAVALGFWRGGIAATRWMTEAIDP